MCRSDACAPNTRGKRQLDRVKLPGNTVSYLLARLDRVTVNQGDWERAQGRVEIVQPGASWPGFS